MSKKHVTLSFNFSTGITNIGELSDLKMPFEELQVIKDIILESHPKPAWFVPESLVCFIGMLNLGILGGLCGGLSGVAFPLNFIGFPVAFLFSFLIWFPHHMSKIRCVQRSHDASIRVNEVTNSKLRLEYEFGSRHLEGIISCIHVKIV